MRFCLTLLAFSTSLLAACANGDAAGTGPDAAASAGDATSPASEASAGDDGAVEAAPPPTGVPSVYDGGPPATLGDDPDAAITDGASASDAALDAPEDAFDAASCGSPGGSYSASCQNCTFVAPVLSCTCTTQSGSSNATTLNICTCTQPSQIANTNGVLTCP